jgi:Cu(I)/Ag(I) efflux system membrane fusion protein
MNRNQSAAVVLLVCAAFAGACNKAPPPAPPETPLEHAARHLEPTYQCPMHPEVRSSEPGQCPICGMSLVLVEPARADERKPLYYRHPHNPAITSPIPRKDEMGMDFVPVYQQGAGGAGDEIRLTAAMQNNLGVRTATAGLAPLDTTLRAVGTVAYDERGRVEVRVRTEGYVERLAVRAEGEAVRRGQALFAVFSPKLAAAQREYLNAVSMGDASLGDAAAGRLAALGLDPGAIERLRATGRPAERVTYYAPEDGVVTLLGIREGALAQPGMSAITLAPTRRLWVVADIAEADADRVRAGAAARVTFPSLPGETFETRVLEVLPELQETTRTLQARLGLDNAGRRLAAGMRADVLIEGSGARQALLVPQEAVIRTGRSERVMVALGEGRFVAREVRSGAESGADIEILQGLAPGEQVVVSGQFMIDSESQVRSSLRRYEDVAAGAEQPR